MIIGDVRLVNGGILYGNTRGYLVYFMDFLCDDGNVGRGRVGVVPFFFCPGKKQTHQENQIRPSYAEGIHEKCWGIGHRMTKNG